MRRIALAVFLLALGTVGGTSCGQGYTEGFDFVRTATVPLGRRSTFIVDAPLELEVVGQPRSTDLVYHLAATMTASTASIAQTLSEAVKLKTEEIESNGIALTFEGVAPSDGRISGRLRIWLPEDMDLQVIGRGGPVLVSDIGGDIGINAATHTRVVNAGGSVRVGVEQGNAIVSALALPGSIIELATNTGDAQVSLPSRPSVVLQAQAGGGGQIFIRHPGLPRYAGGDLPYGAVVNGGLSQVVLTTRIGNIVVDAGL